MQITIGALACAPLFASAPAAARLTQVIITAVEPFAPGKVEYPPTRHR